MDVIESMESRKISRFFRARRKFYAPNLVYHITQRAAGKEPLFLENDDYMEMLALMKEICTSHNIRIHAFCLMPNHVHLLLSPTEKNLPKAMQRLFSIYAMRFNRKYERKGHLFAGPYRQAVCLDDSYLLAASLYIHLNPLRAGIVKDPVKYRWSSIGLYIRAPKKESFVDAELILSLVSSKNERDMIEARREYVRLLRRGAEIRSKEVMEVGDAIEKFLARLKKKVPMLFEVISKKRKIPEVLGYELAGLEEIEDMIKKVRKNVGIRDPEAREAKRYIIEQLLARGFKRGEIAQKLGISRKTVYNLLRSY